jgi:hypothetical protein
MFALFDKNKKFIGYSDDFPDHPTLNVFKFKIPDDKTDIMKWHWVGDMFNGGMQKIEVEKN